jgi:hypothetical protein
MRALVFVVALLAGSAAWAGDAERIASQAGHCWSLPGGLETPPSVEFELVLDADGKITNATAVTYSPKGSLGKAVVLSALRALQDCGPYKGATGTVHVLMKPTTSSDDQKSIDPFKD